MNRDEPIDLVIIGAGGHAREVSSYVQDLQESGRGINLLGFVVDGPYMADARAMGTVVGDIAGLGERLYSSPTSVLHYITAIGDIGARQDFVGRLEGLRAENLRAWTLRHPRAVIGHDVDIGEGTCVAPGVILTTHVRIGRHCILNANASVSHDCIIGEFTNINPGSVVAGSVRIDRYSFIGAGATVIERICIGEGAVIGAGAVVTHDVPPHLTVVGVPARIVSTNMPPADERE
jgi:acetyltransferase EpsM